MNLRQYYVAMRYKNQALWKDREPIREELFGLERLEQHAASLAQAQQVTDKPAAVLSLRDRLEQNASALIRIYRDCVNDMEAGKEMVPAAEWLLDNYHLVEAQIREIRQDLPGGFYHQLPKLAAGPFAGYPRVFGLAWAFIAHTDSHLDPDILSLFITAYQRVQPLTIGELWAVPITLRIVLVENLCRLGDQITREQARRDKANKLADRLLQGEGADQALADYLSGHRDQRLSETFAAQLVTRLRAQDPVTTPALRWLDKELQRLNLSVDVIVDHIEKRQGGANVTIRNVITSMRLVSDIDWSQLFESISLVDAELRACSNFAAMNFATRNLYRNAIEELARHSDHTELEVVHKLQQVAHQQSDPGFFLIGQQRPEFEQLLGFKPPFRLRLGRFIGHVGISGFVGTVIVITLALLALTVCMLNSTNSSIATGWLFLFALLAFLPATDVAMTLISRVIVWGFNPTILPGMALKDGIPQSSRTLIAVPTLLTSPDDIQKLAERLEVHFLTSAGTGANNLYFALVTDWVDADHERSPADDNLLEIATCAIDKLNKRYAGDKFLLLHRRRTFNQCENVWMGWERKRGKLHELNRLLRGATDTTFLCNQQELAQLPEHIRYVITLDSDTRLVSDTVVSLIGKMAHPLNQPYLDKSQGRITRGYGILQPRVTPAFPTDHRGSLFQRIFSGPGGIDPYATAASDIYQDLFQEGSYTGKGIYDVDAFEAALEHRIPENTLLSHDLFEGIYARAGLASDVEVIEDFPASYDVAIKRQHRWTRGDWQLLSWVLNLSSSVPQTGSQAVPLLGRFKMLDNLRRSLIAPFTLAALVSCLLLPWPSAVVAAALVLLTIILPALIPVLGNLLPHRYMSARSHFNALVADFKLACWQILLSIALLPDQAWRMGDAIGRTLIRLFITHHHLLEWTTAAQVAAKPCRTVAEFYQQMLGGTLLALAIVLLLILPSFWPLTLLLGTLWLGAPFLAFWTARTTPVDSQELSTQQATELRLIARRTWRYFEVFVTEDANMLPPDNFQETPEDAIAQRTSPTNIGVYLLSTLAARDFGWAGTVQTIERLEATFDTMQKLQRFNGHFLNWYSTETLTPLTPAYISSVDSGNLAGHLLVVANACEEWLAEQSVTAPLTGLADNCQLAQLALQDVKGNHTEIASLIRNIETQALASPATLPDDTLVNQLLTQVDMIADDQAAYSELHYWVRAIKQSVQQHQRDTRYSNEIELLHQRLHLLAANARQFALAMDFAFLIDPQRKLLAIGYSLETNSRDESCYDLLASEARLASLFTIAKGDAESKHWFRLGRSATPVLKGSALISWSGSMFEYLMPSLVMQTPAGSLLAGTTELAVKLQQSYARAMNIPWGMSESAFNARDHEFTYQYSNFGVPELGLKRGLSSDRVIAPYATGLAAMIDPVAAVANYSQLTKLGAMGRYGFYEALDYTRSRVPENKPYAIVRSFMAHHQGMTIAAILNTLKQDVLCKRFHREPIIQACELLLQERMPREIAAPHQLAAAVKLPLHPNAGGSSTRRFLHVTPSTPLTTHILANGQYSVMLTATGGGYSLCRDTAITRWQADPWHDAYGTFFFFRDLQTNRQWSVGTAAGSDENEDDETTVEFAEDHAEFIHHHPKLTTSMDVVVSMEDDGEVRRLCISNFDSKAKEIEVTSYAEIVLNTPAADQAHPAFSKMFIQTDYLPEFDAIIATRRTPAITDKQIWAAHLVVVEGQLTAEPEFESDRARFIGRGRTLNSALSLQPEQPLSNTAGTVLDPIFSLRRRIKVNAGSVARLAFWTLVADSREQLLALLDKHHDRNAFARAKTLAWTQAQLQLRHLDIGKNEAVDFQRLATPLLYQDAAFRSSAEIIQQGAAPQSALWETGISGDLPIILLYIDNIKHIGQVKQLIRAHEYWQIKQLCVDLVIINEQPSSYIQELQDAIEAAIRSNHLRVNIGAPTRGAIYPLRSDQLSLSARALLASICRIKLYAAAGALRTQLNRMKQKTPVAEAQPERARLHPRKTASTAAKPTTSAPELELFNGTGGFANHGSEYVILLEPGETTPAPWINVIANPQFGFQVSAEGNAYTWALNSRENQLTPWSNDPVSDPSGEKLYVYDEDSMVEFSATANGVSAETVQAGSSFIARHGFGYSRFQHQVDDIELDLLQLVPLEDPIKISRLTLHNRSAKTRHLSVTGYVSWVLGASRCNNAPFIQTEQDSSGAILARNPWSLDFSKRVAFADLAGKQTSWTANRNEYLGSASNKTLSGMTGVALDPCGALRQPITLAPGESADVLFLLGQGDSAQHAHQLLATYRQCNADTLLAEVQQHWREILGSVQVKTPDRAMDIMLNGWLTYQTLACRIWARSAFYQASGAYGFRDQLQDGMALAFAKPDETRAHILRAAARQFEQGDVQHWWLPHSGTGVRTRISDDKVWLVYTTASYIQSSGDIAILDQQVPFVEGPTLDDEQHENVFKAETSSQTLSLFEHCARALDCSIAQRGELGLPLIGTGDWNDGMNNVGAAGKGESVWLGWLLLKTLKLFAPQAMAHDRERAQAWEDYAKTLNKIIEHVSWDGEWYRRATYDDGSWLGSSQSQECRIDSIAQSWAVLSGGADHARAMHAMSSLKKQLISEQDGLVLLFAPPFDYAGKHPGYIQGYPPGLRENGGQYSHAAMWAVEAYAELGEGDQATTMFNQLNPVNHALDADAVARYKVEPYVVAADIYSVAPHSGRGGWTWYTGAAGCMYRAGLEGILGLKRRGNRLIIKPCIARHWPGYEISVRLAGSHYQITIKNPQKRCQGISHAELDDVAIEHSDTSVEVSLDGNSHTLSITL
ncbi:glycosyl transferase [Aliidiomarina sedimenti]|uniref:Glycosyl transferase n=2 Tax=Aliidiomarina sedimenti TaxID=1933879 RepID=A0ABY0C216_9GAMM|nr:glycosyl transferase [Aliidiomarina sedimenti]